ncbi:MAG: protein-tyrosine-phosphatase [Balneolaceae bacterium]|nr:protein-tyrosine-phosphatase [Balneolaceae bacterium]
MYQNLVQYLSCLNEYYPHIGDARKLILSETADYIRSKTEDAGTARLIFICTHNSRRSHFAALWAAVAAHYFKVEGIETFSGGTEVTAFNKRAAAALERAGFKIRHPERENPVYQISFSEHLPPIPCYSKIFDNPQNPSQDFAAIMTCSDADESCPRVPGADYRAIISYHDPKKSDGTELETQTYDERCRQIAAEMFYMIEQV